MGGISSWFALWMVLNVGLTLLNKLFFSRLRAPYPASITFVHLLCSALLASVVLKTFDRYKARPISDSTRNRLYAMSGLFVLNIVVGNASLRYCSVALVQMVRCTIPAFAAVLGYLILGVKTSQNSVLALVPIVVGAALVCRGEIHLTPFGIILTVFGCFLSALKTVMSKLFLSGSEKVHPFLMLQIVSSLGAAELLPIITFAEEGFYRDWLPSQETAVVLLLAFHGFCAFLLNMSNLEATKTVTPLVMTIGGNVKSVITTALGILLLDGRASWTFLAGASITFGGVALYSYVQHVEKQGRAVTLPVTSADAAKPRGSW